MSRKVVLLGAGGHAKVVIEILRMNGDCEIVGLLNRDVATRSLDGISVLGDDSMLPQLRSEGVAHFLVTVGSIGHATPRRSLYEYARSLGMTAHSAIHPQTVISPSAKIGPGATITAGAVISTGAVLGENVIVNTGAIVEHDCAVADHAHVSTGARLCGGVHVGVECHIGAGATVRQQVSIGERAVVGAGAVVIRDVADGTTVTGVPARERASGLESAGG